MNKKASDKLGEVTNTIGITIVRMHAKLEILINDSDKEKQILTLSKELDNYAQLSLKSGITYSAQALSKTPGFALLKTLAE